MRIRVESTRLPEHQSPQRGAGELADEVVGGVLERFRHRIEDVVLHVTHALTGATDGRSDCRIGTRLRRRVRRLLDRTATVRRRAGAAAF